MHCNNNLKRKVLRHHSEKIVEKAQRMDSMKKTLNIECPCGHWTRITFDTVFFEPPLPEPKVRMMKRMYKPLKETKCVKCGRVIAKPSEPQHEYRKTESP